MLPHHPPTCVLCSAMFHRAWFIMTPRDIQRGATSYYYHTMYIDIGPLIPVGVVHIWTLYTPVNMTLWCMDQWILWILGSSLGQWLVIISSVCCTTNSIPYMNWSKLLFYAFCRNCLFVCLRMLAGGHLILDHY
ncbi:hypothetical protein BDQ17DRAFT_614577 [Cyathus striatus]|nr:hypothetical protein BDQ17DRAFT_614577 [Cyathus striatus]